MRDFEGFLKETLAQVDIQVKIFFPDKINFMIKL